MATTIATTDLPRTIQRLLEQRSQHAAAIVQIEQTLAKVTAAIVGAAPPTAIARPTVTPVAIALAGKSNKRKRTKYAVSTNDVILAFVKARKNPTTSEIMKYVLSQGRSVNAVSSALTILFKAKKLKRTPLGKGILGSRYSLA